MGYPRPPLDMGAPQTWDWDPPRHGTGTPPDMGLGPPWTWDWDPPDMGLGPPQTWDWDPPGHGTGTPPKMREMKWRIWKTDNKVVKNCNLNQLHACSFLRTYFPCSFQFICCCNHFFRFVYVHYKDLLHDVRYI